MVIANLHRYFIGGSCLLITLVSKKLLVMLLSGGADLKSLQPLKLYKSTEWRIQTGVWVNIPGLDRYSFR